FSDQDGTTFFAMGLLGQSPSQPIRDALAQKKQVCKGREGGGQAARTLSQSMAARTKQNGLDERRLYRKVLPNERESHFGIVLVSPSVTL
ncbi:MAG: hypothetical protein K940chlam2_01529, partial [Chlamydiae bacterium]|nr:hypothetical protein [Chlamydiota bacterium]